MRTTSLPEGLIQGFKDTALLKIGTSSQAEPESILKPGDILLGHRKVLSGPSDWLTAKVIEKVQGTPFGHSAMYIGDGQVVHAHKSLPKPGVTKIPISKFQKLYDYRAYRVKATPKETADAVSFISDAVGREYSMKNLFKALFPEKAKPGEKAKRIAARLSPEFMCSELIAAAYPGQVFAGKAVESTRPVDFARSSHTKLVTEVKTAAEAVKKVREVQGMKIRIDRPKGFVQNGKDKDGNPWTRTYQYDYGFLPKTQGGDGDGVDVFIGPGDNDEAYWITKYFDDGSFDEYKVFVQFDNKTAAQGAFKAHIPAKYMGPTVTMKVPMMRAMMGISPYEEGKLAEVRMFSFLQELQKLVPDF